MSSRSGVHVIDAYVVLNAMQIYGGVDDSWKTRGTATTKHGGAQNVMGILISDTHTDGSERLQTTMPEVWRNYSVKLHHLELEKTRSGQERITRI
jgi:hypothetical protein